MTFESSCAVNINTTCNKLISFPFTMSPPLRLLEPKLDYSSSLLSFSNYIHDLFERVSSQRSCPSKKCSIVSTVFIFSSLPFPIPGLYRDYMIVLYDIVNQVALNGLWGANIFVSIFSIIVGISSVLLLAIRLSDHHIQGNPSPFP